ncbi:non-canonical purine NTP pyrophosphatase [Fibrobacterales bacterium]|nr:non-canonical purine NTP pyrophosphatase [Fibrobacterales bacterium]
MSLKKVEPQAIVIATGNAGKVQEIRAIFGDSAVSFFTLKDINFDGEIAETADTFRGNAKIKAEAVAEFVFSRYKNYWVLADDSGLEVDALDGRPGIYSARYAGENATNIDRYTKLLSEMQGQTNRSARFVCVLCLICPALQANMPPETLFFEGECRGSILTEPRGNGGFGYDPVFLPNGYSQGFGEMNEVQKNTLSHRGRAIKALLEIFSKH